jgi:DinB superfamily
MNIQSALKSQYHAGLKTLRLAIEQCPDALWHDPADGPAAFWRVAYHTLFFTDFYLRKDHQSFTPWARHRDDANFLGNLEWDHNRAPRMCEPYTKSDLLEYWSVCDGMVDSAVDAMDLSAPQCGFPWYPMPKLEHQLVNIRHIQHHAAALATRLRRQADVSIPWVGRA